jgi:hypothetical protein
MSRRLILICLLALPVTPLVHQAELSESFAASMAELNAPGVVDPPESPDSLGSGSSWTTSQAPASFDCPLLLSFLDGLGPILERSPRTGEPIADPRLATNPLSSPSRRQCWLQAFVI